MSKFKLGQVLYRIGYTGGSGEPLKFETEEWIVRTIRDSKITAVVKESFTWVKLSKKHGDWGWAKYIPSYARQTWRMDQSPTDLATTKLGAWKSVKDIVNRYEEEPEKSAALKTIDRMIASHKKTLKPS